MEIMK